MTEQEFLERISTLYAIDGTLNPFMDVTHTSVKIYQDRAHSKFLVEIQFAPHVKDTQVRAQALKIKNRSPAVPLQGLKILLDPGHIGGKFSVMEERILTVGDHSIKEGDMNLKVASILKKQLEAQGARVYLTKDHLRPASDLRPKDFLSETRQKILSDPQYQDSPSELKTVLIQKEADRMFYRTAEIQARALRAQKINPDLTLCIHFNATPNQPGKTWTDRNEIVIFTHGSFEPGEILDETQKSYLFKRLFERVHEIELPLAEKIADAMAQNTKLAPVMYRPSTQYIKDGKNPYIYARNFLANRIYPGPVIYLEPYYQNNSIVFERALRGDYDGLKKIDGKEYPSIYREYSNSVAEGILNYIISIREK